MRVITVATKSEGYFPYLMESCRRFGIRLDVLGWNTKWQGFNHRLHLVQEFLKTLNDNEIVMFIDAYDVVFTRGLEELENQYKERAGGRVAIAVEEITRLGPVAYFNVVFGKCDGKALNAGTYMGYVYAVKDMLSALDSKRKHGDDQRAITDLCQKRLDTFYLDEASDWFLVSGGERKVDADIHFADGQLWFRGRRPFVLHCPGNRDMTPFLTGMGYPPPAKDLRRGDYRAKVALHQLRQLVERGWESVMGKVVMSAMVLLVVILIMRYMRKGR